MIMRCIVCDRCKTIIENPRKYCRVLTCSRPLRIKPDQQCEPPGNDQRSDDIVWEKELCASCLEALEAFVETPDDQPEGGETIPDNPSVDAPENDGK